MGEDITISREAFDFLMGEGPFEGHWFGDPRPDMVGKFWWRSVIRKTLRTDPDHIAAIREAVEACAKIADREAQHEIFDDPRGFCRAQAKAIAVLIRAHLDTLLQTKGDDRGEG